MGGGGGGGTVYSVQKVFCRGISVAPLKSMWYAGNIETFLKADLHRTTLSHAICLRKVYDTNRFM